MEYDIYGGWGGDPSQWSGAASGAASTGTKPGAFGNWGRQMWDADFSQWMKGFGGFGQEQGGINGIGYFAKATMNGFDIWRAQYEGKHQISAIKWASGQQAKALESRAEDISQNHGLIQSDAMRSAALRYDAISREIASQRVSSAGSGLDLSSSTLAKAEESSRKFADSDVVAIAERAKVEGDNITRAAKEAMLESAYAQINGRYQARIAKNAYRASQIGSLLNMGVNIGKGIADIYSGGMVSMADNAASMTGSAPKGGLGMA